MDYDYIKKGDCLKLMDDIPDKSIDMILCDLPYGITNNLWDIVIPFNELWRQYNRIIKDHGCIALFSDGLFMVDLIQANRKYFKYNLIWDCNQPKDFLNANRKPLKTHEYISIFYKNPPTYNPQFTSGTPYHKKSPKKASSNYREFNPTPTINDDGKRYPHTVINFIKPVGNKYHPTQKPLNLLEWLINTYTNKGDIVLDNCMGSGSTCVACITTDRHYIGFELNDEYFEIARKRIEREQSQLKLDI